MDSASLYGKSFSILGDSYSTFAGFIPEEYLYYYPDCPGVEDVRSVSDTWWQQLAGAHGMRLLVNNSYSGSTVCEDLREGLPPSSAFTFRARECAFSFDGVSPDFLFLFGCTNDFWLDRTLGQVQHGDWSKETLRQVLPAYCYVLFQLTQRYPQTVPVCIINDEFSPALRHGMEEAGAHYGAVSVPLCGIEKQNGHPTARGMADIAAQVAAALPRRLSSQV